MSGELLLVWAVCALVALALGEGWEVAGQFSRRCPIETESGEDTPVLIPRPPKTLSALASFL